MTVPADLVGHHIDVCEIRIRNMIYGRQNQPLLHGLDTQGGLLGIFPNETYTDYTTRLSPGDRLVLYTDGIEVAFQKSPTAINARTDLELGIPEKDEPRVRCRW